MDKFFGKKIVRVYITGRYFEDCDVNGVQDDPDNPTVCGYDKNLNAVVWDININTGKISNWNGQRVDTYYKLVDGGEYVLEVNGECIEDIEGEYVPKFLQIKDDGYGDYVYLRINEKGEIEGWGKEQKKQVVEFFNVYGGKNNDYSSLITNDCEYVFDAEKTKDELVKWIKDWFECNGNDCNAILGISGGKDSTIVARLCVEALGKNRVIGVAMPDNGQGLNDAEEIANEFGIKLIVAPISNITEKFRCVLDEWQSIYPYDSTDFSKQSLQNMPPRVRMTMLYFIAQSNNGRVVGTTNLDERLAGYFTKYGDGLACDLEPIEMLTISEIIEIGELLSIPSKWLHKIPSADLPNTKTDEEELGFKYSDFDNFIRKGTSGNENIDKKITEKIEKNAFKLNPIAHFVPNN